MLSQFYLVIDIIKYIIFQGIDVKQHVLSILIAAHLIACGH